MKGIKMRKLTKQTIKPVISYVKTNVNSGYYKFYSFTLDTYNGKNDFSGGAVYDLSDCYLIATDKPRDAYALDLTNGDVYSLYTKKVIMQVNFN